MRSPCAALALVCLAAILGPPPPAATAVALPFTPLRWLDPEDNPQQEFADETWDREADRQLDNELMAEKRALSALSRWKPFSDTFRSSGRPARAHPDLLSRTVEVETRGRVRPVGQPLRWGRR